MPFTRRRVSFIMRLHARLVWEEELPPMNLAGRIRHAQPHRRHIVLHPHEANSKRACTREMRVDCGIGASILDCVMRTDYERWLFAREATSDILAHTHAHVTFWHIMFPSRRIDSPNKSTWLLFSKVRIRHTHTHANMSTLHSIDFE